MDVVSDGSEVILEEVYGRPPVSVEETVLRVNVHDLLLVKYVVEVRRTVERDIDPVPVPPKAVEDVLPGYGGLTVVCGGVNVNELETLLDSEVAVPIAELVSVGFE